ncbi:polysaccharide biosynthesis tyrosine autokinase [Streptomyces sp. NPDC050658]|uniref:polysaccharide biosynthesis tyrosine autokinase n=1 Tax=unclassified Streptomyces TaxID=2593676 RepID=UPI003429EFC9
MNLHEFLRTLRRRWRIVVVSTLLGLAAGAALTSAITPEYEATTRLFAAPQGADTMAERSQYANVATQRVQSYAKIVASPRFTEPIVKKFGLADTPAEFADRVTAEAPPYSVLLDITVRDGNAEAAARMADALAKEFRKQMMLLETPEQRLTKEEQAKQEEEARARGEELPEGPQPDPLTRLEVISAAQVPEEATSPRPLLNILGGLLTGLFAGAILAVVRESLDTTVGDTAALAAAAGLPVLGAIPYDRRAHQRPLAMTRDAYGERAEAIRLVRAGLQFARIDQQAGTILVTSAGPDEGKSSFAANLAVALAEAGGRVCLVDGDLRRPSVARTFGLVESAGLTTVLIGRASVDEVLQNTDSDGLSVLTSGELPPNPAEMLASPRMQEVLTELTERFDTVVVDSAPVLNVADTTSLAAYADGTVLVVRAGITPRRRIEEAVAALRAVGTPVLGAVLSMARIPKDQKYGYDDGTLRQRLAPADRPLSESLR